MKVKYHGFKDFLTQIINKPQHHVGHGNGDEFEDHRSPQHKK
jgi:hypothetical protein